MAGEKLGEREAATAGASALRGGGLSDEDCTVGLEPGEPPHCCLAVEPAAASGDRKPPVPPLPRLGEAFDRALAEANVEYRAKRDSMRLAPARAALLSAGTFGRLRAALVARGAPDGQVKIPHLLLEPGQLRRLLADEEKV